MGRLPAAVVLSVDLAENSITGAGVTCLLSFLSSCCSTLKLSKLKLFKNSIGDAGAAAVAAYITKAAAAGCLLLEELHMSHCSISSSGALLVMNAVAAAATPAADSSKESAAAAAASAAAAPAATFVYPRLDSRKKSHVPLWLRMEYNAIADPMSPFAAAAAAAVAVADAAAAAVGGVQRWRMPMKG